MDFLANLPWERVIASGLFFITAVVVAGLLVRFLPKILSDFFSKDPPPYVLSEDGEQKDEITDPSVRENNDKSVAEPDLPPVINVMVLGLE
ncbi:MAG: hypothetical protein LC799_17880, partial [Actinobacteria bacterium]|nr:hypothetical protein [Actinomycetota bacterium]